MQDMAVEGGKREAQAIEKAERTRQRKAYLPDVDIIERKDDIVILADMPGVDETSVNVTLEKNVLAINGKVDFEPLKDHKLAVREYGVGDFERSFTISNEIDRDRIQASVKNGVLRLVLPKAAAAKPRTIQVQAEA